MEAEILTLGSQFGLDFSPTSPSVRIVNPQFEKKWFFEGNPREDLRRDIPDVRSGPARFAGDKQYNPIMAIYGLFILQTTDVEVKPFFSISDIPEDEKIKTKEPDIQLIRPQSIIKRNLLEPISYTSYWKKWIDAFDFSSIPDEDISEVGSVTEAIYVLKQMEYTFADVNYNQDDPVDGVFDDVPPVGHMSGLPPVVADIAGALKEIARTTNIPILISSLESKKSEVDTLQTNISELDERGYALEEQIKFLEGKIPTRLTTEALDETQKQLEDIDQHQLVKLQQQFDQAKTDVADLERRLEQEKHRIINEFNGFIDTTLKLGSIAPEVKAKIKNIIMRNKLKNILKLGIRDKQLTLSQVLIFFRSLGYNIVNIVDPSCFTLKNTSNFLPETQGDTQELYQGREERKNDTDRLNSTVLLSRERTPSPAAPPGPGPGQAPAPPPGPAPPPPPGPAYIQRDPRRQRGSRNRPGGGTKRKKSKCSRKRRTRRKRCTTQRRRRRHKRQNF
jgi:hypothetical protein